jgi:hypothetical protein
VTIREKRVEILLQVEVVAGDLREACRSSGQKAPKTLPLLQELQDALLEDEHAWAAWTELVARESVAHHFAKDLHESEYNGLALAELAVLRPLMPRLSPEAQAYFDRALIHQAWLRQHPDGVLFVTSFRGELRGEASLPAVEPEDDDLEMQSLYMRGGLPRK